MATSTFRPFAVASPVVAGVDAEKGGSPEFAASALFDQPFPADTPRFHLLHIENGRAMIQDDAGIFIVEPGSVLPDRSRVEAIEERAGALVLITSDDRVLEVSK